MKKILMTALLFAAIFHVSNGENPVDKTKTDSTLPADFRIYQTENLLRNGNFRQKNFSADFPLFWMPTYNYTIPIPANAPPERIDLYYLTDGVLTMKGPSDIWQVNDITPEASTEYVFSFKSKVSAGSLLCKVQYNSGLAAGALSSPPLTRSISAGKDFETHEYTFNLDPQYTSGILQVIFAVSGAKGEVNLSDVSLRPVPPKSSAHAKEIYIDSAEGRRVLRGITVSANHSFYELRAAKYLQKYLFVGFGRYVDIFIADKAVCEKEKGMVLIGNEFIDNSIQEEIKIGGYAILTGNGNILIGGKEDGTIHGAFAVLSNLGMEFYTRSDFSKPLSECIKFTLKTVKNPAFAYRYLPAMNNMEFVSSCAIGNSCIQLVNHNWYLGSYNGPPEHCLGVLLDPCLYFKKHPEYYALNSTQKCRMWKIISEHFNSKTSFWEYCMDMQICYSNPEVQKIVTENILKWFDACPEMTIVNLLFGDRYKAPSNWCQCENCQKFGVNDTDKWQKFVNIVANEVKKKYPGKLIRICSYAETKTAPINEKPESNVIIGYIVAQDGWACKNHFDCVKNRDAGWVKNVGDWLKDYPQSPKGVTFYGPAQPGGIIHPWADKMKYFLKHGVTEFIDAHAAGDSLRQYVLCKLAWDPYQNTDELITKFTNFYYGAAAPYVKQYVDMIEKCDEARASHDKNLSPSIVDYEFLIKSEKLLGQAIALTDDTMKKESLQRNLLELLRLYVSNNNKSTGLRGEKLQAFAKTFGEFLQLSKEFKIKEPVWNTPYHQFIQKTVMIDIGDHNPWYDSPIVQKILADPVKMIAKDEKAYMKTQQGLDFKLEFFIGGEGVANYQYNGIPKTPKAFARVLRRASSPTSIISAFFDLEQVPSHAAVLELEGLDCEKSDRANMLIKINDKVVFSGENNFAKKDWTTIRLIVPTEILKADGNRLVISNTTPDKKNEFVGETIGGTSERDYTWSWFMISKIKLHLPSK